VATTRLQLTFAFAINEEGEIIGIGVPPGCTPDNIDFGGHAYVLMPCDEGSGATGECDNSSAGMALQPVMRTADRDASRHTHPLPLWQRNNHSESYGSGPRK
jgi:hypothetical protein